MFYSNISLCTNRDKMYIAVNMDDIVFSATVNILGNEFKYSFLYKIYYDIYLYNLYVCLCVYHSIYR